jgi:enhancing lycopene biosynthesis protein 2
MKIGVLLSGCGVYDGAEIQEAVLTLLAIEEMGDEAVCIAVDANQHHVINHISGEELPETRNMLIEAARISRGKIHNIRAIQPVDIDALVIPGGFGSAKNFTSWAFDGANASILPEVKLLIVNLLNVGKPIVALCVSPVVLALALKDVAVSLNLTLGTTKEKSPYDIASFHEGVLLTGSTTEEKTIKEILIDYDNRIICAPCYMMNATILEVRLNIQAALLALKQLI